MSPTARLALTVVCWTLALLLELAGLLLLVMEGRRTGRALRRWSEADAGADAPVAGHRQLGDLVDVLAGNSFDRATAVSLLGAGVVVGTAGNLLGL